MRHQGIANLDPKDIFYALPIVGLWGLIGGGGGRCLVNVDHMGLIDRIHIM